MYNTPVNDPNRLWIESRTTTQLHHLRDCARTDPTIRQRASGPSVAEEAQTTPRAQRTYHSSDTQPQIVTVVSPRPLHYNSEHAASLAIERWQFQTAPGRPLSSASMRVDTPFFANLGPQRSGPSPAPTMLTANSYTTSASSSRPVKYSRTASGLKRPSSAVFGDQPMPWTDERQKLFEQFIARLTASAGFSFAWVGNPEFIRFCQEFLPGAKVPSRRTLANRILPTMLKTVRVNIQDNVRGKLATVQCDGWSGANSHHLVAFMVTVGTQVRYFLFLNLGSLELVCPTGLHSDSQGHNDGEEDRGAPPWSHARGHKVSR